MVGLVHNEAHQQGIHGQLINIHEERGDHPGIQEHSQEREEGGGHGAPLAEVENTPHYDGVDEGDQDLGDEDDDAANSSDHRESHRVRPDDLEPVLAGCAEVFASKGYLDVGVFVQERYDFLQTDKAALSAVESTFNSLVSICTYFGYLLLDDFDNKLQELNHSDNEGSKHDTSKMVPEDSSQAPENREMEIHPGPVRVIPHASR